MIRIFLRAPRVENPEGRGSTLNLSAWDVLESVSESLVIVDRSYRVMWAREPLMVQYDPEAKLVGNFCYSVFINRSSPCPDDCPVRPVFSTGRPHTVERRFTGPQGEERWREARAYPIVDRRGRVAFVLRIGFDITERKKDQSRFNRHCSELERSVEEMNRLQLESLPFQPAPENALTRRELEVLRLVAQGFSNPRISTILSISPNTVKRHLVNIFNKLGVNDRARAAVWAVRRNLV